MANRYPIITGGASNTTATWATSSGQAVGGASIPVSGDAVICDATMVGNLVWTGSQSFDTLDCTGCTGTMSGSGTLTILGDTFKLAAGMTYTATGTVTFTGANAVGDVTLTRAGKTTNQTYIFNGAGKTFKLADNHALGSGGTFGNFNATDFAVLDSQGFDITCNGFNLSNTTARTAILTGSAIVCNASTINGTNLTWSGPDSITLQISSNNPVASAFTAGVDIPLLLLSRDRVSAGAGLGWGISESGGDLTIGEIQFINSSSSLTLSQLFVLTANVSIDKVTFPEGVEVLSSVNGTQRTITTNTNEISFDGCMIRDIVISGGPAIATGSIDLGNNSGITFQNVGPYTHEINGVTYDDAGAILGGVTCVCYEDTAPTVVVSTTTSDAVTGAYTLPTANGNAHTVCWSKGSANRGDAMHGIIPTPA